MFTSNMQDQMTMLNTLVLHDKLIVGGQPTVADLILMHGMGVTQVINLRPETEIIDFDEVSLLKELGMQYHLIPLTDITTFTKASAKQLQRVLDLNEPCLLHCATGNRVGALIALQVFWLQELTPQEALDKGLKAGLTRLRPHVEEVLGLL